VQAEAQLATLLGIDTFVAIVGGSMGGMRVLEWLAMYPSRVQSAVLVATTAVASADQIGTQSVQIAAITSDPDWRNGDYAAANTFPRAGLSLARQIAHLTYRSESELAARFGHSSQHGENALSPGIVGRQKEAGRFAVQSYLQHHGHKLVNRFDAGTYVSLTDSMNTHDVARGRGTLSEVLGAIRVPVTVAGVSNDRLYPIYQQQQLVDLIPTAESLQVIDSMYGHDGFLIETNQVGSIIEKALTKIGS
jgi:homoserine O-acetyltransferase